MSIRSLLLFVSTLLLIGCENNVGRAFDGGGGGGGGGGLSSNVQTMVVGGIAVDGRPRVRDVFPTGAGWPASVPIVVVFNESMSADSIIPPQGQGGNPTLTVRAAGVQGGSIPLTYDFLLGDSVVLLRPATPFPTDGTEFEVVIDPEARDIDGVRFGGTAPEVIATFTPNQDEGQTDGRILVTLPQNNERDRTLETPLYAIFDRPAEPASVNTGNFLVQTSASAAIPGSLSFPLSGIGGPDGRVLRFDPDSLLPASTQIRVTVDDTIQFGTDGTLDFGGRTPFAEFQTLAFAAPQSVVVGNASTGFPQKVNRTNLETLQVDVAVDASAGTGDEVTVRLYGLDNETTDPDDVNFVERQAGVPAPGAQTVRVDFTSVLGTLAKPRFADGSVTFATQLRRGSRRTGFVTSDANADPRLDVTPPELTSIGPPTGVLPTDYVTDHEYAAIFGIASERIAQATLTSGSSMVELFAGANDGSFLIDPLLLGRSTAPVAYQLTMTDAAGNVAAASVNGTLTQRGVVTGSVAGGTLVVEAYDDTTLRPVAGATVLIEPGLPTKPATGRLSAVTGQDGRAMFTGLTDATYSVTIVASGFDLKTLLDSSASFASLPLRPSAAATATYTGRLLFQPGPGLTAMLGSGLFDDRAVQFVSTVTQAPTEVPATAIRPNRPHLATGFAGAFEPTTVPAFLFSGCVMCGPDGLTATPPFVPVSAGEDASGNLTLLTASPINLAGTYVKDFADSGGLDTANLSGTPTVRIVGGLRGLTGMPMFGLGFATAGSGASYTINGTFSLAQVLAVAAYAPVLWVSTEARDMSGNIARHRRLIANNTLGTTFPTVNTPGIPTLTAGGSSTGSPSVTYADRLDASTLLGGIGFTELIATDATGRRWSVVRGDRDGATGSKTVQIPDLAGTGLIGLATGTWTIRAENTLLLSVSMTAADYVLEETRRQEVTWARAAPQTFTIN